MAHKHNKREVNRYQCRRTSLSFECKGVGGGEKVEGHMIHDRISSFFSGKCQKFKSKTYSQKLKKSAPKIGR